MLLTNLRKYQVILASKSPRRQYLLKELGIDFKTVVNNNIDEVFSLDLKGADIALHLAKVKADACEQHIRENVLLITADTIVWLEDKVMNKPENFYEAFEMLKDLSGKKHQVITGVCIRSEEKTVLFDEVTEVYFKELSEDEIKYYINAFKPYDKAGAYGIQEWIGYIGINRIEGSYFNVMGLPVRRLYEELLKF